MGYFAEERPVSFNGHAQVATVLIRAAGKFLLLRKTKVWPGRWTCPGGRIEAGESSEQAAIREVFEETKILITPDTLTLPKAFYLNNDWGQYELHAFAVEFDHVPEVVLNEEHDQFRWVSYSEAIEMELISSGPKLLEHYLDFLGQL
jgi:8-oxo-dGTP pyrophosphatase MutT (NUDIX family)